MVTISIWRKQRDGYIYYSFKPLVFVDDFVEHCARVPSMRYDHHAKRFTASARAETIQALEEAFGKDCLVWDQADSPGGGRSFRPGHRGAADSGHGPGSGGRGVSAGKEGLKEYAKEWKGVEGRVRPKRGNGQRIVLRPHWQEAVLATEEQLMVRRYSPSTIKGYLHHLRGFLDAHPKLTVNEVTNEVIRTYIVGRTKAGQYSASTQGQMLNALKFWLEKVEGRERSLIELRPKKRKTLPRVLSVEEVQRLFGSVTNLKHRCILKIIYGGGLRLSEAVNLRIADVHSDRLQLFVHGGKGKKDRYTTLSLKFLEELRRYFTEYQPDYWLFEGQSGGAYSVRSVQMILRKAVDRSGINPYCTVHTLRHSYATHLLEAGVSLRHIQELLGHANSSTTEIYTHVSNSEKQRVISPLDRLE